jgi:phospholipid/cholesterol/gamma-HCH transport system substrate-binding protein
MAQPLKPAVVGAFVVAGGVAAVFAFRFLSHDTGTGGGYKVYAYLPDVTGVAPHSRVTISGIQVGTIDKIWLDHGKARVDVKMFPTQKLFDDAAIAKKSTSLIGESVVVLTPGTEGRTVIPDGGEIKHYLDSPTIENLESQVSDILKDVKEVTNSLKNTVGSDSGQKQIGEILKNLAEVTEQLNETVKENRAGVRQTINNINSITGDSRPQIAEILKNVRSVTEDVRKMTTAGDAATNGRPGEIKTTVDRISRASSSLESTLAHADKVAERLDKGEGTLGRLTKDETLINEVEGVVEDVGELVGGISRVQTVVGLRTDYNFLANTIKTYVELRLQPAEDKYYSIELVNDPRGKTSITQTDYDTTNPNLPSHYREIAVATTNSLRFSFQFAKRFGPFTGRFGIKESTGGIGLDINLLDDRFELRQDLFGFGEELSPRWRVSLAYEFIKKLWLLGGVDDIFSADRRDYFVGLQLRFTDNDLKTILPFAGGAVAGGR